MPSMASNKSNDEDAQKKPVNSGKKDARCLTEGQNPVAISGQNCLVGLVLKASASRAEDPGFEFRLHEGFFRGQIIPVS